MDSGSLAHLFEWYSTQNLLSVKHLALGSWKATFKFVLFLLLHKEHRLEYGSLIWDYIVGKTKSVKISCSIIQFSADHSHAAYIVK